MAERSLGYRIAQIAGWLMLLSVITIPALLLVFGPPECIEPSASLIGTRTFEAPPCSFIEEDVLYEATLSTELGDIEIVLDPSISPTAVNAFVFLAIHGWYDGTVFHRIEVADEHAYVQGGAANPDGTGHAGFLVAHEPPSPILQYPAGTVAGIVSGDPLRMGSQFFIVGEDWEAIANPSTFPIYPPLGKIFDLPSLGVVRQLIAFGSADGTPALEVTIERIAVDRIGEDRRTPVTPPT